MTTKLLVVGSGGHAKVVIDAVRAGSLNTQIVIADEDTRRIDQKMFKELPIVAVEPWVNHPEGVHIAIGNNEDRKNLFEQANKLGKQLVTIIHPTSYMAIGVQIGKASFIAANAIVSCDTIIGMGCIVNHAAVVDHDCRVGDFCHIAPNVSLGGGVQVGEKCLIGAGAVILPQITIGDNSVIGAGAVVAKNIAANKTVVGVPARCVNK